MTDTILPIKKIAPLIGVSIATIAGYASIHDDFPKPVGRERVGKVTAFVYSVSEVLQWRSCYLNRDKTRKKKAYKETIINHKSNAFNTLALVFLARPLAVEIEDFRRGIYD